MRRLDTLTWRSGFLSRMRWLVRIALTSLILASTLASAGEVSAHVSITRRNGSQAKDESNVVVWLTPVAGEASAPELPAKHYRLVQKNKQFSPHLLVVPVGSVVDFPNEDPFFHNVFSFFQGKRFDLGLYEAGSSRAVKFDRVGVSFIFCNIHPEMSAAVVALPTRLYAVSGAGGEVLIPDVPPGEYRMQVWHELASAQDLAKLTRSVRIEGPSTDIGKIAIREVIDPNPPHKNKYGQDYEQEPRYGSADH
jgi:plastocyanin